MHPNRIMPCYGRIQWSTTVTHQPLIFLCTVRLGYKYTGIRILLRIYRQSTVLIWLYTGVQPYRLVVKFRRDFEKINCVLYVVTDEARTKISEKSTPSVCVCQLETWWSLLELSALYGYLLAKLCS